MRIAALRYANGRHAIRMLFQDFNRMMKQIRQNLGCRMKLGLFFSWFPNFNR